MSVKILNLADFEREYDRAEILATTDLGVVTVHTVMQNGTKSVLIQNAADGEMNAEIS